MSDLLPSQPLFRVTQSIGPATRKSLEGIDYLVVIVPHTTPGDAWKRIPEGMRLRRELQKLGADDSSPTLRSRLAGGTGVTLGRAPRAAAAPETGRFPLLKCAGELLADALSTQPRRLAILASGFGQEETSVILESLVLAAGAASFRLPEYRRKPARAARLQQVHLIGHTARLDLRRTLAEVEASNLVRWLTALPPNKLTVGSYREVIAQLSEHHDWSMRFLDTETLRRLGAGAFLAVAQGSAGADAGIAHLSWRPPGRRQADVALVGKGIVFDTGGTNLKPFRAMLDMHHDMSGSAVALGVLLAATRLGLPLGIDCWLAITENRIGPQAYKSRDVVRASDGTSIEVIHTDAEGRMALADTLALAAREEPGMIIDYATLTGQCVNALTDRYSGVFTNRTALHQLLIAAGRESGERVWPFPMDEDYDEELKSTIADVVQCSVENEGDHILAARFLQRFVPPSTPWVHVDLAAATRKKGLAHVPSGPTGFGVRVTLNLLIERRAELGALLGLRPHDS
jgi:leucyl aminopeptidase